jgi:hypothetical protein
MISSRVQSGEAGQGEEDEVWLAQQVKMVCILCVCVRVYRNEGNVDRASGLGKSLLYMYIISRQKGKGWGDQGVKLLPDEEIVPAV